MCSNIKLHTPVIMFNKLNSETQTTVVNLEVRQVIE